MAVTNYYSVGGELLGESTDGVETTYMSGGQGIDNRNDNDCRPSKPLHLQPIRQSAEQIRNRSQP